MKNLGKLLAIPLTISLLSPSVKGLRIDTDAQNSDSVTLNEKNNLSNYETLQQNFFENCSFSWKYLKLTEGNTDIFNLAERVYGSGAMAWAIAKWNSDIAYFDNEGKLYFDVKPGTLVQLKDVEVKRVGNERTWKELADKMKMTELDFREKYSWMSTENPAQGQVYYTEKNTSPKKPAYRMGPNIIKE